MLRVAVNPKDMNRPTAGNPHVFLLLGLKPPIAPTSELLFSLVAFLSNYAHAPAIFTAVRRGRENTFFTSILTLSETCV